MADKPDDGTQNNEQQNFELRRTLATAYAFVKGNESTQSFASFSFEDAMDAQIERIEGKDSESRPNVLHRIDKIENDVTSAAEKIKKLPKELFNDPNPATDVNTPPEVFPDD